MAVPLSCGQIIWAEIADANGIRKGRPAVIVTPDDEIVASGLLKVVAITSSLKAPLPTDHVLLPWHAKGHPRTGLNRKCAAVCSWVTQISVQDVQSVSGKVPPPVFAKIAAKVAAP